MKLFITTVAAALFSLSTYHAQGQQLPEFPELKVAENYAAAESQVKDVADWLEETDLDKQEALRRRSNAFILEWVTGSPTVTMTITKDLLKVLDKNPHLAIIYMARYASYCITNKNNKDKLPPTQAGLTAIAKVYKKGIGVKKNKALDKLVSAIDQNQLDDYMVKHIKAD